METLRWDVGRAGDALFSRSDESVEREDDENSDEIRFRELCLDCQLEQLRYHLPNRHPPLDLAVFPILRPRIRFTDSPSPRRLLSSHMRTL